MESTIEINWALIALALVLMLAGIALFVIGIRGRSLTRLRTWTPFVWALIALGPALVLFSIFRESAAEGDLGTFKVGGAFAAFVLVWITGTRFTQQGIEADGEVERLKRRLATTAAERPTVADPVLTTQERFRYRVRGCRGREIAIITGDLRNVRDVDVWVSPENTNMQPSRFHERSVSGLVRYLGAERDEDGEPVTDVIGDALSDAMRTRAKSVVPGAAVVVTAPGALAASNGVKRIYHVAAVAGTPGAGYAPVPQIGRCLTNALERMDAPAEAAHDAHSIIFPLLGTGVAGGQPTAIAMELLSAAAEYLAHHTSAKVQCVCFLAYRESELLQWMNAADSCRALESTGTRPELAALPAATS